jgi:hypothetical protein
VRWAPRLSLRPLFSERQTNLQNSGDQCCGNALARSVNMRVLEN